ncbi:MAG: O-antigen ligase family protein [Pseudomonadota bacterium]
MMAVSRPPPASPSSLTTWTQNAAIFAACANLFSTALANLGFVVFLLLFACLCASGQRRQLDTRNFPVGVAVGIGLYVGWQVVGLTYTDAPMSYALKNVFSERKICYILPLALIFSDAEPKRRFLAAFLGVATVGLGASFALSLVPVRDWVSLFPAESSRVVTRLISENTFVFRSNVTQGMVFVICVFLALWYSCQAHRPARVWALRALASAFAINIATVTHGRSGYVVFLVLVVWCFALWRGLKGVAMGALVALFIGAAAFTLSSSVHDRVMRGIAEAQNFSTTTEETSLGRRMVMYQTTLGMIRDNPLLGVGTGGFKQSFSAIAAEKYSGWRAIPFDDPHNQYLFVLAENGLVGLITFLLMIGMILKYCLKGGSIYGKMAAGCVLAWCATSLFSGHFRTFPEGHLIAFIVGILMVNRPPGTMEIQPERQGA